MVGVKRDNIRIGLNVIKPIIYRIICKHNDTEFLVSVREEEGVRMYTCRFSANFDE
jgi:hypothetical protein